MQTDSSSNVDSNGFPNTQTTNVSSTYKLAIIISCCFVFVLLTILLVFSIREAFFIKSVKKWKIFNYENKEKTSNCEKISPDEENNHINSNLSNPILKLRIKSKSLNSLFVGHFGNNVKYKKKIQKIDYNVQSKIVRICSNKELFTLKNTIKECNRTHSLETTTQHIMQTKSTNFTVKKNLLYNTLKLLKK